jgi:hypothetical protein
MYISIPVAVDHKSTHSTSLQQILKRNGDISRRADMPTRTDRMLTSKSMLPHCCQFIQREACLQAVRPSPNANVMILTHGINDEKTFPRVDFFLSESFKSLDVENEEDDKVCVFQDGPNFWNFQTANADDI